jgi:Bacterial membrane protein YfhO
MRLNASRENVDRMFSSDPFPGMNDAVYRKLRESPEARIALDSINPLPMDLRHYGLSTPQGGDPLVPAQYSEVLPPVGNYFGFLLIEPGNQDLLRLLGVRYFLTSEGQPQYERLLLDKDFSLLQPANSYFKVFEFSKAQPPYRWETTGLRDWIRQTRWTAEQREFRANSEGGGRFVLIEQFYPGWRASIDGNPTPIERWHDAFQSVMIPPGAHQVRFTFRSGSLRLGAIVSVVSMIGLVLFVTALRIPRPHR